MSKSDKEIIKQILQGSSRESEDALHILYKRYSEVLFRFMYFMLDNDTEKANDFLQDIFLRIVEKNYVFNFEKNVKNWLFTLAANLCKNEKRRLLVAYKYKQKTKPQTFAEENENHDFLIGNLWKYVNRLDENQRQAIIFRYRLNWSVKEIAEFQNCPEGTVKSRLFFAIKKLSEKMNKYAVEYFNN